MYKVLKWLQVIKLNQSPFSSTRSFTQCTKLYRLRRSVKRLALHNFSPAFLFSSPSKVATFGLIEKVIDVLMMDMLIYANTPSSFGWSFCSWLMTSSLTSYFLRASTSTVSKFFPQEWPFFFRTWIYYWRPFSFYFLLWYN